MYQKLFSVEAEIVCSVGTLQNVFYFRKEGPLLRDSSFSHLFFLPHILLIFSQVFHDVAYKAKDRNDLVSGIDEFLDQVTVLPPGEWDPTIRIEPPKNVPSQVCAV